MTNYTPPKISWPKDWFIKLISLAFAIFLWYFVSSEDRVDMNVQVPVEIVNLPRDMVIANQYKTSLDVMISGPRGLIRKISENTTRSIDLSKAQPGTTVITNDPETIPVPRGINVLRINPSHLTLRIDRLISKELPIKPVTRGSLGEDFELVAITTKPDLLQISGPQNILGRQQSLNTEPIDLGGVTASTSKSAALELSQELADLIGDPVVSAHLTIKHKLTEREVGKIDITPSGLGMDQTAKILPGRLSVRALMPRVMARKSNKELDPLFTATVNVEGLGPGRHDLTPSVAAPAEVTIQEMIPDKVTVEIK